MKRITTIMLIATLMLTITGCESVESLAALKEPAETTTANVTTSATATTTMSEPAETDEPPTETTELTHADTMSPDVTIAPKQKKKTKKTKDTTNPVETAEPPAETEPPVEDCEICGTCEACELMIKQDYVEFLKSAGVSDAHRYRIKIDKHLGTYNGSVVFHMPWPGSAATIWAPWSETVAGYSFLYGGNGIDRILVWNDGNIYTLSTDTYLFDEMPGAYDLGLLTEKQIQEIHAKSGLWG